MSTEILLLEYLLLLVRPSEAQSCPRGKSSCRSCPVSTEAVELGVSKGLHGHALASSESSSTCCSCSLNMCASYLRI